MATVLRTRRSSRRPDLLYLLVAFVLIITAACGSSEQTLEQRASGMDKKFMCPVCPGETIDQAQVQIAKDMRQIIREKLAAGEDESDISQFFVDRYGIQVLASPPTTGFTSLVWIVPPVVLGIALTALYMILRDMRRGKAALTSLGAGTTPGATSIASKDALAPYLDAIDEEMRQSGPLRTATDDTVSTGSATINNRSNEVNGRDG
jgi:cytochrome c-type biogenesis protein CcmH